MPPKKTIFDTEPAPRFGSSFIPPCQNSPRTFFGRPGEE
jgi:hypothetical protein